MFIRLLCLIVILVGLFIARGVFAVDLTGGQTGVVESTSIGGGQTGVVDNGITGGQTGVIDRGIGGGQTGVIDRVPDVQCQEVERVFPQCGGTTGLEGFPATDTIMVGELTDSCTGAKRFVVKENRGNLGQCQVAQLPPPARVQVVPPQVIPQVQTVPQIQTVPPVGAERVPPVIVQAVVPTPIIITPPPAPVINQNLNNRVEVLENQSQSQSQSSSSISDARTGPISINTGAPQVIPAAVSNPQVVTVPQQVTTSLPVTAPTVASKELPKTGIPLLAWPLAGLLPAGFGLRRFNRSSGPDTGSGRYIWQAREYLRK